MRALLVVTVLVLSCAQPGSAPPPFTESEPPPSMPPSTDAAPRLTVEVALSAAQVSVGQRLTATLTVTNDGAGAAASIKPLALGQAGLGRVRQVGDAPSPGSLGAGAQSRYVLELEAVDPGPVGLAFAVQGVHAAEGTNVVSPSATASLTVQSPPLLSLEQLLTPTSANVDDDFEVRVTMVNGGEATARDVRLDVAGAGASPAVTITTPAPSFDLEAGTARTVSMRLRGTTTGTLSLEVKATARDDNGGASVESESLLSTPISIERAVALSGTLSLPAQATRGQRVFAVFTVRNTGTTVASAVTPSRLDLGGGLTTIGGVSPAQADVPGGGEVQFVWPLDLADVGMMTARVSASGLDANSRALVSVGPIASSPCAVLEPSQLQVVSFVGPAVINPGQPFDVTLSVRNRGTAAAVGVVPDPLAPSQARTLGAAATLLTPPAAQTIAPGATATFTFRYLENGTSPGALAFTTGARGTDQVSGATVSAVAVQSTQVEVAPPPALAVVSVAMPRTLSVGQGFSVTVMIRNIGGSLATQVAPRVSFTGSTATLQPAAPVDLPAGAVRTFVVAATHTGLTRGTLTATTTASGLNAFLGQALSSPPMSTSSTLQRPAELTVTWVQLPNAIAPGHDFTLGAVVSNSGEAAAAQVLPAPLRPLAVATGGALASASSTPTAQLIPGGRSRAFIWTYRESGTGPGSLAFSVAAQGVDANSQAALSSAARSTAMGTGNVGQSMTCSGSAIYTALNGERLEADRATLPAGTDRLRLKPYSMLPSEFSTRLGSTPPAIVGQTATYDVARARWFAEQQLSAVSVSWTLRAAFQACEVSTRTDAAFASAPTSTTANVQCAAWQRRFWLAEPEPAELGECVRLATSPQAVGATPRLTWATVCAAVATSAGFLAH